MQIIKATVSMSDLLMRGKINHKALMEEVSHNLSREVASELVKHGELHVEQRTDGAMLYRGVSEYSIELCVVSKKEYDEMKKLKEAAKVLTQFAASSSETARKARKSPFDY